jgi:hypothetical protein
LRFWVNAYCYMLELILTTGITDDVAYLLFTIDQQCKFYLNAINRLIFQEKEIEAIRCSLSFSNKFQLKDFLPDLTADLECAWVSSIE